MKRLYIFVEGDDDERFMKKIVCPFLINRYSVIDTYKYAIRPPNKVKEFIGIAKDKLDADILCFSDMNDARCITQRKDKVCQNKFGDFNKNNIIVVKRKIEGWYLAGLDDTSSKKIGIPKLKNTNNINKASFDSLISKTKFIPRISCMTEILDRYNVEIAINKNDSFRYFCKKYLS